MAITALPLDCWLKERLKGWIQLSGHENTIIPASNTSLWKKQPQGNNNEARAYAEIMEDPDLRGLTPRYFKEMCHNNGCKFFICSLTCLRQFDSNFKT